ncbi:xenotropic and polytropic retrovirus receptor 1-like isoform X3 [Neodiprion virginianus]|uniref:xenotropic and polytropic retrovirus receptor 1-like isoform X3 n=1 Tax=Neodiprion virginianus TaxID=2961670 RepID=UPI001EE735E5|nr:xenotropic and polytropic retrovirus receptor 1-like isoform X3 [Neodiprion virginianus]
MKFAEHLGAHITPEWRKQYINYEEMKALLYAAIEQAPAVEAIEPHVLERYFSKFDETFFHYCDKELAKINTFYSEKLAEAMRRYATLTSELSGVQTVVDEVKSGGHKGPYNGRIIHKKPVPARKIRELKLAFSEFYLSLILLQNYQNLNFTGFRKILKKHDKLLNVEVGSKWRAEHVEGALFHIHKDIDRLIGETEAVFTRDLEHGDRQRAMKRLRVPPLGEQLSPWITFKVGLFSGAFVVLLVAVVLSGAYNNDRSDWRVLCRLYRGPFLMIQFFFLMGINVYGWRSSGVNHVLIFELDPRNHLSEQHIIEMASIFGIVWTLSVLGFLYSDNLGVSPFVQPVLLYAGLMAFLFNPTKTLRHEARFWALRVMGRIFCAPFFYVGFADFWLADQLNSLQTVFLDLQYFVCFYTKNSSWTRVTDRYQTTTQNPYFYLWVVASVVSSCFAYTWDVKLDWGLLEVRKGENKFLREEIVYTSPYYYYFAIVEDFILRFGWAFSLSLTEMGYVHADLMVSIVAPLEVFRRFVWNFFRLENEHLNNCGKFRAVRDISIAPIDRCDRTQILRMMDATDGVRNRRNEEKNDRPKSKSSCTLMPDVETTLKDFRN